MPPHLPASNLERLKNEILSREPAAALPCNLSSEWLALLARDLEMAFEAPAETSSNSFLAAPLAVVVHLLMGKSGGKPKEVEIETLFKYCDELRMEIALETISRRTDIHSDPATLATMFSDRDLHFQRKTTPV